MVFLYNLWEEFIHGLAIWGLKRFQWVTQHLRHMNDEMNYKNNLFYSIAIQGLAFSLSNLHIMLTDIENESTKLVGLYHKFIPLLSLHVYRQNCIKKIYINPQKLSK